MHISYSWLQSYFEKKLPPPAEIAEALTLAGLEVESFLPMAGKFRGVIIAEIILVESHPNADRLRLCTLNIGKSEPIKVVCGGANVRVGLRVPYAQVGSELPGNLKMKVSKIRGIESPGMLCAAEELELKNYKADGIVELPSDAPLGEDFAIYWKADDIIFDISITPNRGDCLSALGMAREIAAVCGLPLLSKPISPAKHDNKITFPIEIKAETACPKYCGCIIQNIRTDAKTPPWIAERLRVMGTRLIHPIVDVCNYVMYELGEPLHAFDFSFLKKEVVVRFAKAGESVLLLDGQTVELDEKSLVIADAEKVLALAGIMGGEVGSTQAATHTIFIEAAHFDAAVVSRTQRHFGLQTDGAYRFARGVDPALPRVALERVITLLLEITGGEVSAIFEKENKKYLPTTSSILLHEKNIEKTLGFAINLTSAKVLLERLGMWVATDKNYLAVTPPSYRLDVKIEVDLIEELARIFGYKNTPVRAPLVDASMQNFSIERTVQNQVAQFLKNASYQEIVTYSFVKQESQTMLDPAHVENMLCLQNPIAENMNVMRTNLWTGLVEAAQYNLHRQVSSIKIFEIGRAYTDSSGNLHQPWIVAGLITGDTPEHWQVKSRMLDFFDIKGDVENLLSALHLSKTVTFEKGNHPALHPGQQANIVIEGTGVAGIVGALHPQIADHFGIKSPVYLFSLTLSSIFALAEKPSVYTAVSKFPAVRRDLAFMIDAATEVGAIEAALQKTLGNILKNVIIFDVYQGNQVESQKRSVAMGLIFQSETNTLTDEAVNDCVTRAIAVLEKTFGAQLRV